MSKLLTVMLLLMSFKTFAIDTIVLSEANTVSIKGGVNHKSIYTAQVELYFKCSSFDTDLYLVIDSSGGDLIAANQLVSFTNGLSCKVHTITINAQSAAYYIVQSLGIRYALTSSTLFMHNPSLSNIGGELEGKLENLILFYKTRIYEIHRSVSNRTKISLDKYMNLIDKNLHLTALEAKKHNHIDKIVNVRCDETLFKFKQVKFKVENTVKIKTISSCPLFSDIIEEIKE